MLKYTTAQVTFREIPDEITLCINISNCPIHCPDCHSKELWNNVGIELTPKEFNHLIEENKGITCICFMGGYWPDIYKLLETWKYQYNKKPLFLPFKLGWYTGISDIKTFFNSKESHFWSNFIRWIKYVKFGQYIKELGPLDSPTTNQRFYKAKDVYLLDPLDYYEDITYKFWKKD